MRSTAWPKTIRSARFAARLRQQLAREISELAKRATCDPVPVRVVLEAMLAAYPAARTLLHGATVALIGPPNSGKSTLFNRLLGRDLAITSPVPGTTRDWITGSVEFEGVPVTLLDTAGRRESADPMETLAIVTGVAKSSEADIVLLVFDGARALSELDRRLIEACSARAPFLIVANKADLETRWDPNAHAPGQGLVVSATEGTGCDVVVGRILQSLGLSRSTDPWPCVFTQRQAQIAERILTEGFNAGLFLSLVEG
jgi:tRNA modification GTPase